MATKEIYTRQMARTARESVEIENDSTVWIQQSSSLVLVEVHTPEGRAFAEGIIFALQAAMQEHDAKEE